VGEHSRSGDTGLGNQVGHERFSSPVVGRAAHHGVAHAVEITKSQFDFPRIDLAAGHVHTRSQPAGEVQTTLGIEPSRVARQELAVAELERQKDRLATYATQARYAVAQLYDRANLAKKDDDAPKQ